MAEIRWTLQAAAERVADFPGSGRVVPEVAPSDVREILLGSYRVIYRVRRDLIEILAVFHGARLLDPSRLL